MPPTKTNFTNKLCYECKARLSDEKGHPYKKYDKNKKWIRGEYLCQRCHGRNYQNNDPNSQKNIMKSLANKRTGNQDPKHSNTKGDMFENLSCKLFGVDSLNIKHDNYRCPIDHSSHPTLGILQTQADF